MGTADGTVLSTTKIVDHGPEASRWNLVILSEGYRAAEMNKYHLDAEAFATKLFQTAPFTEMWCALNVYRVDVTSTDSGADRPAGCLGSGPAGSSVRTYFDASYCRNGTDRLLFGDQTLARDTAKAAVPAMRATVVIVNDAAYGGAGGVVAWFSTHADAGEIALHELGHTAFLLGDEYGENINNYTGPEPPAPNLTKDTNRATTKWAARIAAGTAVPTQPNPNCGTENPAPSPVPAGTIGLFEGGARAHCGLFHPEFSCRMRTLGQPFCVICRDAIRRQLAPNLPAFSGPVTGIQFTGTVAARRAVTWFTYDWPACWHVIWTVVPSAPVTPAPGLGWRVRVERASREKLTYWIEVSNQTDTAVDIAGRYEIVARV